MILPMDTPLWMWAGFFGIVAILLVFDLGFLHRRQREISVAESLWLSAGYIAISLCFGLAVYHTISRQAGRDFFTGYFIEKSLSMDNIFVMSMVFTHFSIPRHFQHRVLFWGVLGVIALRGLMIGLGSLLVEQFHFVLFIFAAFLIITGLRMLFLREKGQKTIEENTLFLWLRRRIPVTATLHDKQFFVDVESPAKTLVRKATPLFLVLVFIELADIVFALDSVPAVFAITTDSFVVYTSNIFAILGLRALYFALAAMLHRFTLLKYALALVLIFIGGKVFLTPFFIITSGYSMAITLILLSAGIIMSLYSTRSV